MRACVIGMGRAGRRHAAVYAAAGWTVDPIDKGDDWRGAIRRADVVSIATPDNLHFEMMLETLAGQKPVMCEKPLTHDRNELRQISTEFPPSQIASVNLPLAQAAPPFPADVYLIVADYLRGRREPDDWRFSMSGYSLFCGGGIHATHALLTWFGQMQPTFARSVNDLLSVGVLSRELCCIILTVNFGFTGEHKNRVCVWTPTGPVDWIEHYDPDAALRQFVEDVETGNPGNLASAIRANFLCLDLERLASGQAG